MLAVADALADPSARPAFEPETGEARKAAEEVKRLRAGLRRVAADYDGDLIDGARYKAKRDKITADLNAAETALAATAAGAGLASITTGWGPAPDGVRAGLAALPLGSLRTVVGALMTVRLARAPRGKHFDPASVIVEWRR
jgi:hypothetical protein